ncbi:MAG: hypothetical protein MRY21_05300 [Simkaniaceae bacterium]|nr:hypothetical protein [Simkaniaceae bacterium]
MNINEYQSVTTDVSTSEFLTPYKMLRAAHIGCKWTKMTTGEAHPLTSTIAGARKLWTPIFAVEKGIALADALESIDDFKSGRRAIHRLAGFAKSAITFQKLCSKAFNLMDTSPLDLPYLGLNIFTNTNSLGYCIEKVIKTTRRPHKDGQVSRMERAVSWTKLTLQITKVVTLVLGFLFCGLSLLIIATVTLLTKNSLSIVSQEISSRKKSLKSLALQRQKVSL